ncbi:hypothetical protein [Marinifilum sp.]|uniref:hypothetical protein n=1 Tax=Marinifilum sp. TaxID=2033137 RepID=UPI003BA8AA2E
MLTCNFLAAQNVVHYSFDSQNTSKHFDFSTKKEKHHESDLEVGLHYGPAWTSGEARDFAHNGSSFSVNLGANNGVFYFGTEFSVTHWKDHNEMPEAKDLNFNELTFYGWCIPGFFGRGQSAALFNVSST